MNEQYAIEARSLNIAGLWSHNFWVLRNPKGQVMAELHGLATDRRSNQFVPIGTNENHSLRAWHFAATDHFSEIGVRAHIVAQHAFYQEGQRRSTVFTGGVDNVMPRWRAAAKSVDFINTFNLNYPPGGVNLIGRTKNSNSMYSTFADIMQLPRFSFWQVFEPGLSTPVMTPDLVDAVREMSGEVWDPPVQSPVPTEHPPANKSPVVSPVPRGTLGNGGFGLAPTSRYPLSGLPRGTISTPYILYRANDGLFRPFEG